MSKFIKIFLLGLLTLIVVLGALLWRERLALIRDYAIPQLESVLGFSINGEVTSLSLRRGMVFKNLSLGPKDKPVLRADEGSVDIAFMQTLKNKLFADNLENLEISKVFLKNAMLSARQEKEGQIVFFPEVSDPNKGEREKKDKKIFQWKINEIEFVDSSIEFEMRPKGKQISLSKINLKASDFGTNTSPEIQGDVVVFVRDSGLHEFKAGHQYDGAFHGRVLVENLGLKIDEEFKFKDIGLNSQISNFNFFYKGQHFEEKAIKIDSVLENKDNWWLKSILIKTTDPSFKISHEGELNLSEPLKNLKSKGELKLPTFNLEKLAIIDMNAQGNALANLSYTVSNERLTSKGSLKVNDLLYQMPSGASIKKGQIDFNGTLNALIKEGKDFSDWDLTDLSLKIKDEEKSILDTKGSITLLKKSDKSSKITLDASVINFDGLIYLLRGEKLASTQEEKEEAERKDETASNPVQDLTITYPFSPTTINITADQSVFRDQQFSNLILKGKASSKQLLMEKFSINAKDSNLEGEGQVNLNGIQDFNFKFNSKKLDVNFIKAVFSGFDNNAFRGSLLDLRLAMQGEVPNMQRLKESLKADLHFKIGDVYLPRELMDVPPFNLLFVPFTAVSSAFRLIPDSLLPDDVIKAGNGISKAFKDAQTFRLHDGDFNLKIHDEAVFLDEVKIGTSVSGDLYLSGKLCFDGSIDVNSGVSLLGVRVPIPLTGTLESPRPDVVQFTKALFTEFGLSVVRLPLTYFERLEGLFTRKKGRDGPEAQTEKDPAESSEPISPREEDQKADAANGKSKTE